MNVIYLPRLHILSPTKIFKNREGIEINIELAIHKQDVAKVLSNKGKKNVI